MDKNRLYYGDNFDILREHIASESVDLIYLDPPFNSKRNYNIIYDGSTAQAEAFKDTWSLQSWQDECRLIYDDEAQRYRSIDRVVRALEELLSRSNPSLFGYLVMMAVRLVELRRILKDGGSIYLHCDPTASHFLKVVMDSVFGSENFRNEIVWKRTFAHGSAKKFGPVHDVILFYSKSTNYVWNYPGVKQDPQYISKHFKLVDEDGRKFQPITLTGSGVRHGDSGKPWRGIDPTKVNRHWAIPGDVLERLKITAPTVQQKLDALDESGRIYWPQKSGGTPRLKWFADELGTSAASDIWDDIPPIGAKAAERLGYPTQKPEALLELIIQASSNEGDVVLDPFCGCGTTVAVAQRLKRRWIGIDITFLAVNLIRQRLLDHYYRGETGLNEADARKQFDVEITIFGIPRDLEGARQLAAKTVGDRVRKEFEKWAVFNVGGVYSEVKGADAGMDGYLWIYDSGESEKDRRQRCPIQVKSGQVHAGDIRDFSRVIEREAAPLGLFVTLEPATKPMRDEIARMPKARLKSGREYDRIIMVQVADILDDKLPNLPVQRATKRAGRVAPNEQGELFKEDAD